MTSSRDVSTPSEQHGPARREVLRGAGAAGGGLTAAAALAACGSGSSGGGNRAAAGGSSTAAGGSSTAAGAGGSASRGVATSKVPVGSGVIDADLSAVITQPTSGDFKAFSNICTHQGCAVSQISGQNIICPCHGSEFSIKDGSVVQGPATRPLPKKSVTVKGSQVIVS